MIALPLIGLIGMIGGPIVVLTARIKFITDDAPTLFETNPVSPFWLKRHRAWFRSPGYALHAIGVIMWTAGITANLVSSALRIW